MSTTAVPNQLDLQQQTHSVQRTDTLRASVMILLVMSVVQRLIGFTRGVFFCRWLSPEAVGQWDVAFGFVNLAVPLLMFGLPECMGRYTEHHRQHSTLRSFIRRTLLATALLVGCGVLVMWFTAPQTAHLVFGSQAHVQLVAMLSLCVISVAASDYVAAFFTSLRLYRVNSYLQCLLSLGFATLSLSFIAIFGANASSVVLGFTCANFLVVLVGLWWLIPTWQFLPRDEPVSSRRVIWSRELAFATGAWVVTWLSNAFEVVDRYMIVHFSGLDSDAALVAIGNYHSARVVPQLLVSISALLGAVLLPHLSKDWESGLRASVDKRLNLTAKSLGFALTSAGVFVVMLSPLLFGWAFRGKYDGGLNVLPMMIVCCIWLGMAYVVDRYLWCAERPRLISIAFAGGLLANIVLNLVLLPTYGLYGAVVATSCANLLTLVLILILSRWSGMEISVGTWLAVALPLIILLGPWWSISALGLLAGIAATTNFVLQEDEKDEVMLACTGIWQKLRVR